MGVRRGSVGGPLGVFLALGAILGPRCLQDLTKSLPDPPKTSPRHRFKGFLSLLGWIFQGFWSLLGLLLPLIRVELLVLFMLLVLLVLLVLL